MFLNGVIYDWRKKLLDTLQQWHDDAEKMKEIAVSDEAKIGYESEEWVLYTLIDMVNNGDFNCDW